MTEDDSNKFQFAIDRGGTFTDIYAKCPGGKIHKMKLLSVDPNNYEDAPREGIRRILQAETGQALGDDGKIDNSKIDWIRMGTTVATNALLERKGERMALVINKGFRDILFIGNQARPSIFALDIQTPGVLYEEVLEVNCRIIPALQDRCQLDQETRKWRIVKGTTHESLYVTQELDEDEVKQDLIKLKEGGFNSIAVVLAHSYVYHEHELIIGRIARQLGFENVSLSHQVMPMVRIVSRGFTACADAYLTPHIQKYLQSFTSGFKDNLEGTNVLFMQSDGGLTPMQQFNGSRAILSGPAGGVVGYAVTTYKKDKMTPVIGFDMGGTSTDVSRYDGHYEHVYESTTAGITIQCPQLDVNTVAAGGGSMLFLRAGLFVVGPESAGAHPGPTCYMKDGPLTVTDANLVLGRLVPEYFPKIFGPNENEPIDKTTTLTKMLELTREVNSFLATQKDKCLMTMEEVAMGFIRVANETMCRPIRALTQAKGHDTSHHILACFGGAGGQHACAIARSLGMSSVFVHKYAGILSAYGMALADVVQDIQEPCALVYCDENFKTFQHRLDILSDECTRKLCQQGFSEDQIVLEAYLHLRYESTDCALMCVPSPDCGNDKCVRKYGDFKQSFLERYRKEFGFVLLSRSIIVDDIRIRGTGKSWIAEETEIATAKYAPKAENIVQVYFENAYLSTNIYLLQDLCANHTIQGPAIIMDNLSTILVEPGCEAVITKSGDIKITIGSGGKKTIGTELDSVQLSIFSHRFMSIAEQMGRILQRTAISTNIKERLDFSCALFGPDGGLVSNAPHIPVHLGAMQETVQYQMRTLQGDFKPGDVILSNHPCAGGSHLPDLTVITPVFYRTEPTPVFFVASRGHHADIGGITPGSMPPNSTALDQEGATFKSFKLVDQGIFNETGLIEELMRPEQIPGSSGSRNLSENISDLKAQIAANQKGINLVCELIEAYGLDVVQAYMQYIQENAELAVREMLYNIGTTALFESGKSVLQAVDYMDDGSPIQLEVQIDLNDRSAVFDFTGTGYEVWGNCNAPRAITMSALIYCLRCMVGHDVPLNQGCLKPIQVIIPTGSLLDPSDNAAVVGGNVQTSQRIVDVVFRAFNTCAASQGCMNNVTFGEETWGYYETVGGGSGAGPTWNGRGGVHTHMTNTRITDAEILERRYPVMLNHFSLRPNSGGVGKYYGGDGIIRELLFRRALTVSVLTERRVFEPYGLEGGQPGKRGRNLLLKENGRIINLGAKTAVPVKPGDVFRLETPGGGAYGELVDSNDGKDYLSFPSSEQASKTKSILERGSIYEYRKAQESA